MQQLFYTGKIGRGMQHDFVLVLQETKKFQLSDEGYVLSYYKIVEMFITLNIKIRLNSHTNMLLNDFFAYSIEG